MSLASKASDIHHAGPALLGVRQAVRNAEYDMDNTDMYYIIFSCTLRILRYIPIISNQQIQPISSKFYIASHLTSTVAWRASILNPQRQLHGTGLMCYTNGAQYLQPFAAQMFFIFFFPIWILRAMQECHIEGLSKTPGHQVPQPAKAFYGASFPIEHSN